MERYLEGFGLTMQFIERDGTAPDTEQLLFTYNPQLFGKLETEAMQYIAQGAAL